MIAFLLFMFLGLSSTFPVSVLFEEIRGVTVDILLVQVRRPTISKPLLPPSLGRLSPFLADLAL